MTREQCAALRDLLPEASPVNGALDMLERAMVLLAVECCVYPETCRTAREREALVREWRGEAKEER